VERLRADQHGLDWENQPLPYKIYPALEAIALPRDWAAAAVPALEAIAASPDPATGTVVPTCAQVARLLLFSAGIVRKSVYASGREAYFRAAACTGALYHVDVYLVCGALPGLEAGVYHFGVHDFALRRLRAGDHRATVVAATAAEPAVAAAPLVLVYASTFWRNAWKYRARAYRHCFWDAGTMLANAIAAADGVPARVVLGFVDAAIHDLLGLDPAREAALALLAVGRTPDPPPSAPPTPPLTLATVPLSAREIAYAEIPAAHDASSLATAADVAAWRAHTLAPAPSASSGPVLPLPPAAAVPRESIDDVIRRRGSTRAFARLPIAGGELALLLERATGPIAMDVAGDAAARPSEIYLIVNAVAGIASGAYAYDRDARALAPIRAGDLRREAGFLDLGQDLAADASVDVYLLADLGRALAAFGDRGYRVAQLAAAITGGRIYLGAYALRLGATGLTFFDDAVTTFFSPPAAGRSVMFLAAVGRARTRAPAAPV
jgi:SagB-type dehydrogenase family enzyme